MKKEYDGIKLEIIVFDKEDVITTSGTYKFGVEFDNEKIFLWDDEEE